MVVIKFCFFNIFIAQNSGFAVQNTFVNQIIINEVSDVTGPAPIAIKK